ncbi:hypothetical protein WICMUC_001085 [Wickerhamomyces mucosus]|uniref:tRNA-5-taurinomethyluridine 2-sulfurtransferase n=1 Tax=Wickerhamomyces mucosus TaxID=1378264 RepID=A0A9P8PXD2_9ASCO|nr:hypothetical protein WICMUC_001085 [Wickerhamomyces mucosus]
MYQRALSTIKGRIPSGYKQLQPSKKDLIIVAMSSGVDSSVAASFYKDFPNVQGIFMQNWNQLDSNRCLEKDFNDVLKIGEQLKIPIDLCNFEKDYWLNVFEPMINSYSQGITPNPDINCNRFVKFGRLINYIEKKYQNKDYWLVTGHYSRVLENLRTGKMELLKGYYKQKDQSYYLSQINNKVLNKLLLPIGHFTKPEIRDIASELDLYTAKKPDSTGLCFVNPSQGKFNDFLRQFIEEKPGSIKTKDGKVWGKHEGLWSYTRGQKLRGISLPQGDINYRGSWYISEKNILKNEIIIVQGVNNEELFDQQVYIEGFVPLDEGIDIGNVPIDELRVQYRSLQKSVKLSEVINLGSGKFLFKFKDPRRAVAVGQYLCVYHFDRCLGSGIIHATE